MSRTNALPNDAARLEMAVLRTARTLRKAYDRRLAGIGLNMTQASLLLFLQEDGPMTQRELADRLHIGRAAAGGFIDGLEGRGLVTRNLDASDRRVWRIELTEAATSLVVAFKAIDAELHEEVRAGMSHAERRSLAEMLLRLEANVVKAATAEVQPVA